ncbi:MAG TPA: ATP-binding protein [Thermoleophilaceae bacterium]|nr:ATP-binding protein [Thermoleophilaceae bacterium]
MLRRSVAAQTAALLLILALATGLFFLGRGLEQQVRGEEESIIALQALRAEIVTAQSSVRGYQLVRRERFLGPYRVAVPAARRKIADVRSSIEADERAPIERIEAVFEEWLRRFAEPTIAFVRQDRTEAAEALARTGSGKRRIDEIKALLGDVVAAEQEEIEAAEERADILGGLAIAGIAVLCLAVVLALRTALRRLNVRLTDPLDDVAAASRRLGGGDLSARVEERGVHEVEVVGRSFNKMAGDIEVLVGELRQLDELKGEFVSAVSHELRTPLTSIKGYLESVLAEEAGPLNELQREELEIAYRNATRLQDLANDLLTLARLESGSIEMELRPLDLGGLLAELRKELQPAARRKGLEIRLECARALEVEADGLRLHQALGNLIANAIKFSHENDKVAVRALDRGDEAVIEVSDRGVGIPADEVPRLKERFYRASTAGEAQGTGLGLSITQEIVERHGGRLEVESRVGAGSTFRIRLPMPSGIAAGGHSR